MKVKIEKAWINHKCCECGKLIYPDEVYRVRAEKEGSKINYAEWRFCKKDFNKIFREQK